MSLSAPLSTTLLLRAPLAFGAYLSAWSRLLSPLFLAPLPSAAAPTLRATGALSCAALAGVLFGFGHFQVAVGCGVGYFLGRAADAGGSAWARAADAFGALDGRDKELLTRGTITVVNIVGAVLALRGEAGALAALAGK
ncbi:hypothetical protein DFJ74DRAFT_706325 [Hyaloraphidium curvatum]|nr:hypothetical protein DFJ74DRAFT_706325 [Hyaloraphidium curvatum]